MIVLFLYLPFQAFFQHVMVDPVKKCGVILIIRNRLFEHLNSLTDIFLHFFIDILNPFHFLEDLRVIYDAISHVSGQDVSITGVEECLLFDALYLLEDINVPYDLGMIWEMNS